MAGPLTLFANACQNATGTSCITGLPTPDASSGNLHNLLQIVFGTMAVLAVLIVVIAGLNFVSSQGDPQKAARAREVIIYALIGLIVAVSAEVIVTFVLGRL